MKSRLDIEEAKLKEILANHQSIINDLNSLRKTWASTLTNAKLELSSEDLLFQIESNIDSLDQIRYLFREDSDLLQNKMVQVSNSQIFCNRILSELSASSDFTGRQILKMTQPPIWKALRSSKSEKTIISAQRSIVDDLLNEVKEFGSNESFQIILHIFIFIILLFVINAAFKNLKTTIDNSDSLEMITISRIISKPIAAAFMITFLISYILYSTMPSSISFLNLILLFVPVMLILYDIMPVKTRRYIILPSIAVLLAYAHSYSFSDSIFSRLFLIAIDLFSISSVIFAIRKRTFRDNAASPKFGMVLYYLAISGILLMVISLIGAVSGAVRLAEFITYAALKSVALVFIIFAINKTFNSIIYAVIHGRVSQNLKALSIYLNKVYEKLAGFVSIISWLVWAILSLKLFALWERVYGLFSGVLGYGISIGNTTVSLADIVVFIIVIWITIWLSRIIKIVIEGEIAPRVKMKRGVPGATTLLLRIAIITVGFLLAISAAGVEMDKLTILLGALGVGIGFGLQNIFNNLVSGIILAFERPVQEGDIIEVGTLWGTVKDIGIRSSTVFTFDGAEVIVPNGNLISNELINWTLTNQHRRITVTVGVKYGTDPVQVLDILNEVAVNEPMVLKEPAPLALFSGFGDSSLDFKLLFWIEKAELRMHSQSAVNVSINRAIKEAGIEIPFPQVDLHVRSVDGKIPDQFLK
jgi:small-conductance mechanosensitive channel